MQEAARFEQAALPVAIEERRKSNRVRTVYRVARVQAKEGEGLARIRNLSDDGMRIDLGLEVVLNQWIRVWLSDSVSVEGQVVWTNDNECGLKFPMSIDSVDLLRRTAEQIRLGEARAPRVLTKLRAVVSSQEGIRPVRVQDVSQRGMKLIHDGSFTTGLPVKVTLESGMERRGVVRWVQDGFAGLMLTEMFSVEDLKTINGR